MEQPLVFVVGDSISMHYGPHLEGFLRGVFRYARRSGEEEALRNIDLPVGANGGDSGRVLAYLRAMATDASWRPDVLLVNAGLHDISFRNDANQVPLETYRENLEAIVALAEERALPLVWVLTTPVNSTIHHRMKEWDRFERDVAAYNTAAAEIMAQAGVPVIDLFTMTDNVGMNEAITADGVHFVPAMQREQAAFIAGWLFARADVRP